MVTVSDIIGKNTLPATPANTILNIQKDAGVKTAAAGIEWDKIPGSQSVDVDIWMILIGANGMAPSNGHFVFYNNPFGPLNCCYVTKDNRDGSDSANKATETDGYDELAVVTFSEIPQDVTSVILGVSIDHSAAPVQGQTFASAANARAIVYDMVSKRVLAKCDLSKDMAQYDGVILGKYVRGASGFTFETILTGVKTGIMGAIAPYGVR